MAIREQSRKPVVDAFQAAALRSLVWLESVEPHLDLEPIPFTYKHMMRSQRIGYQRLKLMDPEFVALYDEWRAAEPPAGPIPRDFLDLFDKATFTMHISRHGDTLTITAIIEDPVYLTEPHILNRSWQLDPTASNLTNVPAPCVPEAELAGLRGEGYVPHYLPGKNPFVDDVTKMYHIPVDAVLGGAETMYPEYRKRLKDQYVAPTMCTRYCCGWGGGMGNPAPGLMCIAGGSGRGQ